MTIFSRNFVKDAIERAISTAAQAAAAVIGVAAVSVLDVDWSQVGGVSALAAILSVLKSLAATRRGNPEDASLVF